VLASRHVDQGAAGWTTMSWGGGEGSYS